MPASDEAANIESSRLAALAKAAVEAALGSLGALPHDQRQTLPLVVTDALTLANEALSVTSECRRAEPYAPILLIGTDSGLRYECTHSPPHIFRGTP